MQSHAPNYTQAVKNLQRYLRRLALTDKGIPTVPIDGIFDTQTASALSAFQRAYGLSVTGRADRRTWELLFEEYSRLLREEDRLLAPDLFPRNPKNYRTSEQENHAFISLLQFLLNELLVLYGDGEPLNVNGYYDMATQRAVENFQRIHGLPTGGGVDRNTWNRLSEEYNLYAT